MKTKKERIRSEKGFTLIELIIAFAIMGILSAILLPTFTLMTRKARINADIATIKQVQRQVNFYMEENDGKVPADALINPRTPANWIEEDQIVALVTSGCIKEKDTIQTKNGKALKLQSKGARLIYPIPHFDNLQIVFPNDTKELELAEEMRKASPTNKDWLHDAYY